MPEIKIPGVYEIATSELMAAPSFVAGDVQISIGEAAFANTTNLPSIVVSGSPVLKLELTDAEFVASAIIKMDDQDDVWLGPTIYGLGSGDATGAKQDEIKALLAAGATVRVPLSEDGKRMDLILGDYHSDQVMLWTVEIDYQNDFTGVLTITDRFDKSIVHKRVPVSVLSATQVAAPFTAEFDSDIGLCGSPQVAHLRFALTMIEDIGDGEFNETTPQLGDCFVKARGTTSA